MTYLFQATTKSLRGLCTFWDLKSEVKFRRVQFFTASSNLFGPGWELNLSEGSWDQPLHGHLQNWGWLRLPAEVKEHVKQYFQILWA